MKGKTWNDLVKPIVVLVVICILSSAALAGANYITAPIIAQQQAAAANAAFLAVLPEADNFDEITEFETTGVSKVLKAQNGAGWVIQASAKGFGGDVPAVVGFDAEGSIVKVQFMENSETAGFGQKLVDGSEDGMKFAAQFEGKSGAQKIGDTVDAITGATVSSKAAVAAINSAVNCFAEVALGQAAVVEEEVPELTADTAAEYLAGGPVEPMDTPEGLKGAYKNGDVTVLAAEEMGWEYGTPMTVMVAFDGTGAIKGIWADISGQTPGIGDQANGSEYLGQYTGIADEAGLDGVDTIAGATQSTIGVKKAVRKCIQAFAAMNA